MCAVYSNCLFRVTRDQQLCMIVRVRACVIVCARPRVISSVIVYSCVYYKDAVLEAAKSVHLCPCGNMISSANVKKL